MPPDVDFRNIRHVGESAQAGFEEFCCQVARMERGAVAGTFRRFRPPDFGCEATFQNENGGLEGWQAKYFLSPQGHGRFGASERQQVVDSFRTAIEKHPTLVAYHVCIPCDLTASSQEREWQRTRNHCIELASTLHRDVTVDLWDRSALLHALSDSRYAGRLQYWFDSQFLSSHWFRARLAEALSFAGPRYTPQCHVDLPIQAVFDGLLRLPGLRRQALRALGTISHKAGKPEGKLSEELGQRFADAAKLRDELRERVFGANWTLPGILRLEDLLDLSRRAEAHASRLAGDLMAQWREHSEHDSNRSKINNDWWEVRATESAAERFSELIQSPTGKSAVDSILLIDGVAGTGKSHLLLDAVQRAIHENRPAVFVDCRRIRDPHQWKASTLDSLGLSCTWDDFVDALDAAGETAGCRSLLVFDGLNECDPGNRHRWKDELPSVRATLLEKPNIGLCCSFRSGYEQSLLRLDVSSWPKSTHEGFGDFTEQAVRNYFREYGLTLPHGPILSPEFSNGLFLRHLCQAAHREGLSEVPIRQKGLTWVFDVQIRALQDQLINTTGHSEDPNKQFVRSFLEDIAGEMITAGSGTVPNQRAYELSIRHAPTMLGQTSLLHELVKADWLWQYEPASGDVSFGFSFNRLQDHMVAESIVSDLTTVAEAREALSEGGKLRVHLEHRFIKFDQGILEAVALLIGERFGIELIDYAEGRENASWIEEAWVDSLNWRSAESISLAILTRFSLVRHSSHQNVIQLLIVWAASGAFAINADWLHDWLSSIPMIKRDGQWSVLLEDEHSSNFSIVRRVIDWSRSSAVSDVDDTTGRRVLTLLGWFTTVSTARIRDAATKGMVNVLSSHPNLSNWLLKRFELVDDPGVFERVSTAVYGAAMRWADDRAVGRLANTIWSRYFHGKEPPLSVLTRDSLRGVLRLAKHRDQRVKFSSDAINGSFGSAWTMRGVPSASKLKSKKISDEHSTRAINLVVSRISDFDVYDRIYDCPNIKGRPFSRRKLSSPRLLSQSERITQFESALVGRAKELYEEVCTALTPTYTFDTTGDGVALSIATEPDDQYLTRLAELLTLISAAMASELVDVLDFKFGRHRSPSKRLELIPDEQVQRWVAHRVLGWGYPSSALGSVDEMRMQSQRRSDSDLWKGLYANKYLQLAALEARARLADNFWAIQGYDDQLGRYECWNEFDRLVDPSVVSEGRGWFSGDDFSMQSGRHLSEEEWLSTDSDLPSLAEVVIRTRDGVDWIVLREYRHGSFGFNDEDDGVKRLTNRWISVILFEPSSSGEVAKWYSEANLWSQGRHGGPTTHTGYLGELGWSPATYPGGWHNSDEDEWTELQPSAAKVRGLHVDWSRPDEDRSIAHGRNLCGPCRTLMDEFRLRYAADGVWKDESGEVVAFDSSGLAEEPPCLLMRMDKFLEFIKQNDLQFAWEIQQEKIILHHNPVDRLERCGLVTWSAAHGPLDQTRVVESYLSVDTQKS